MRVILTRLDFELGLLGGRSGRGTRVAVEGPGFAFGKSIAESLTMVTIMQMQGKTGTRSSRIASRLVVGR